MCLSRARRHNENTHRINTKYRTNISNIAWPIKIAEEKTHEKCCGGLLLLICCSTRSGFLFMSVLFYSYIHFDNNFCQKYVTCFSEQHFSHRKYFHTPNFEFIRSFCCRANFARCRAFRHNFTCIFIVESCVKFNTPAATKKT